MQPYVSSDQNLREFSLRAVLIGLVLAVVLGAANAYLGLKAGMTIAATYPAAVISMALIKLMKGTILEENMGRTVGSIGESVAAGAIFTIPAFVMSGAWSHFDSPEAYWKSTALMLVGGALGILFVTLLRRVMVEDPDLPELLAPLPVQEDPVEDEKEGMDERDDGEDDDETVLVGTPAPPAKAPRVPRPRTPARRKPKTPLRKGIIS